MSSLIDPTPCRRVASATRRRPRRGSVLVYSCFALVALCAVGSLAVDYGRLQLAKSELHTAADLAARYAATGIKHEIDGVNAAPAMAQSVLAENRINSKAVLPSQATTEVGVWNQTSRTFTANSDVNVANAVRVTVRCQRSDATAIPASLASILGLVDVELSASAIAMSDPTGMSGSGTAYVQKYVPATSNLWLAGEPAGTSASNNNPHNNPDYAGTTSSPAQSPVPMSNLRLVAGSTITFDGVNGGANNSASTIRYTGDGNTGQIVNNYTGAELSKSNITAPINSVIAVFLDDNVPSGTPPASLDFSTATSRDFQTLKPQLNQMFFIGDGRRDNGDMQNFVVPAGAKRLFIGTMDAYEWNNNVGGFTVTATAAAKIVLVR